MLNANNSEAAWSMNLRHTCQMIDVLAASNWGRIDPKSKQITDGFNHRAGTFLYLGFSLDRAFGQLPTHVASN